MMRIGPIILVTGAALAGLFVVFVPKWTLPVHGTQLGNSVSSMVQFAPTSPTEIAINQPPPAVPPADNDTRPATSVYKNVTVLTDVDAGQFMRVQHAMTQWVSPGHGCAFCHAGNDYASDAKPAKQVARLMLKMTRHINADWRQHVGKGGVNCYTCHRGQPVPAHVWFPQPAEPIKAFIDKQENWNESAHTVRDFFPTDGWDEYLLQDTPALAQPYTALPSGQASAQIVVKRVYEMMMQMSDGIGVNCGYCHNSRALFDWRQSTPMRWTGYSGLTMTRDLNRNYLLGIGQLLPENRSIANNTRMPVIPAREQNPLVGNGLSNCATCHNGAPKPFDGADMLGGFPALTGPGTTPPAAPHS